MTDSLNHVDVAILGGGFAGTMVAANLLASALPLTLALVERRMPPGRGVAYGTPRAGHLLNIPAGEMSAWSDDPAHFTNWLAAHGHPSDPGAYIPRPHFGEYVTATLGAANAQAPPDHEFTAVADEAVGLLPAGAHYRIRLASGHTFTASQVVIAVGQFPPAPLKVASDAPWYVDDAWSEAAFAPLAGDALLIGTGLTAVDVGVTLLEEAGAARVTMVSRRAQLPAASYEGPPYPAWFDPESAPLRISRLLQRLRAEIRATNADWRAVVDAFKPHVPALWAKLPLVERRRFLRHARSFWEAARNRLPPPTAARVASFQEEGRLVVLAGRLLQLNDQGTTAEARLQLRSGEALVRPAARVINCTGPDTQYRQINHPLILDLIGTGLARPDPLGLGLDTAPDGRLKDEDGLAERPIYTLGWPRIGQLWEATTVPSLRMQAADVARRLARKS